MIELAIKEAKAREKARALEAARSERLHLIAKLEEWLGEEKVEALKLDGKGHDWFLTFKIETPRWWGHRVRTIKVRRPFGTTKPWADERYLEVLRDTDFVGKLVEDGDDFLVQVGELR